MYDIYLMEDIRNFKVGADNIYEINNRYQTIGKIIKNRTKEKLELLKLLLCNNLIDIDIYNELLCRVKSDYRVSFLYLIGMVDLNCF